MRIDLRVEIGVQRGCQRSYMRCDSAGTRKGPVGQHFLCLGFRVSVQANNTSANGINLLLWLLQLLSIWPFVS